jgi:hypothetical protein
MLLRALGKHPCALPAIVDTPGCVDALVAMLSLDNLAVAAGAADALSLCLEFVEAKAVLVQAGVVPGLQGLKRRAAASQHKQALETAELVLALIGQDALGTSISPSLPSSSRHALPLALLYVSFSPSRSLSLSLSTSFSRPLAVPPPLLSSLSFTPSSFYFVSTYTYAARHLSVFVCVFPSLYVCVSFSLCTSLSLSSYVCVSFSLCMCVPLSLYVCLSLSARVCLSLCNADTAVGMKSPLYEHLKGLGLDKGLPSKKIN